MKPIERMVAVYDGRLPDRVPFVPTIYEHAAYLIGRIPSEMARDPSLIVEGQLQAFELYRHDLVAVGVDIYNVECEALGSEVVYFDGPETPGLVEPLLDDKADLQELHLPDPERSGRMPLLLEAAVRVKERLSAQVLVSGTVVGPFTMAANLRGFERLVMDAYEDPDYAHRLMGFATQVGKAFADAFVAHGLGVAINESWIAPPLMSPALYRELVVGYERELISHIKARGQRNVGLISGGDTTPLLDDLIGTGTSLLIADYNCDFRYFKERTMALGVVLRGNVDPKLVESGPMDRLQEAGRRVIDLCAPGGRFVLGTGVIPYATPAEHLLALRELAATHGTYVETTGRAL